MAKSVDEVLQEIRAKINGSRGGQNTQDSSFSDLLNRFGSGSNNEIASLLNALGIQQTQGLTGDQRDDWNKQLLDTFINYSLTQENRKYNEGLRDEQRIYDNPMNQLALLMGSGISRDAAIAMLSAGSSGSGSSGVPYSQAAAAAQGIAPSQSALNGEQRNYTLEREILDPIDTMCNMVGAGMGFGQATQAFKMLKSEAVLSQENLAGITSSNKIMSAFADGIATGDLDPATIDSLTNGNDALQYAYDHRDTNLFKGLFDSGDFQRVYGTSFGRRSFSDLWHDVTDVKNYGTQLEQFIKHNDLQNELHTIQSKAAQRDYFFGLQSSINSLIKDNEEIGILWNQYLSGQMQVTIDGERVEQAKIATNINRLSQTHAERESYKEGVHFDAFKNFVENGEPSEPDANSTGRDVINYMTFGNWCQELQKMLVFTSQNPAAKHYSPDGTASWSESYRDRYKDYLKKNQDLLYTGAFIQQLIQEGRLNSWQGDQRPIWQFFDMWRSSGASDFVGSAAKTAGEVGQLAVPFML